MRQLQAGNIRVLKNACSVRTAKHGTYVGRHRQRSGERVRGLAAQADTHIGDCKKINRCDRRDGNG
jgi:hypothetical protein